MEGFIFDQPWWLDIVSKDQWKELVYEEKGKVVAKLICVSNKKNSFMPQYVPKLSIWIDPEVLKKDKVYKTQRKIYAYFAEQLNKFKSVRATLTLRDNYFLPFLWKNFLITPGITYQLHDLSNVDELFNTFSKGVRNSIRKADKQLHISYDNNFEYLETVLDSIYKHQNRKYPGNMNILKQLFDAAVENKNGQLITALSDENQICASTFVLYNEDLTYAFDGGVVRDYSSTGAESLVNYETIKFASKVSKVYDFGGSIIEPIEYFVSQFGGKPTVYYMIEKRTILQHIFNFYRRKIKGFFGYKQ